MLSLSFPAPEVIRLHGVVAHVHQADIDRFALRRAL
jgi:hypothetical protein